MSTTNTLIVKCSYVIGQCFLDDDSYKWFSGGNLKVMSFTISDISDKSYTTAQDKNTIYVNHKWKLEDKYQQSHRSISMWILIHGQKIIIENVDVVKPNLRYIFGFFFPVWNKLYIDSFSNDICAPILDISSPFLWKHGNMYPKCNQSIIYCLPEKN